MLWSTVLLSILLQQTHVPFTRSQFNRDDTLLNVVRVRALGFLPFEQDILPYAVIYRIIEQHQRQQKQMHNSRIRSMLPWVNGKVRGYISSQPPPPVLLSQRQVRQIEPVYKKETTEVRDLIRPSFINSIPAKRYRIYDGDDGERLLDLRVHQHMNKEENKWKVTAQQTAIKALDSTKEENKIVQHYVLHLR